MKKINKTSLFIKVAILILVLNSLNNLRVGVQMVESISKIQNQINSENVQITISQIQQLKAEAVVLRSVQLQLIFWGTVTAISAILLVKKNKIGWILGGLFVAVHLIGIVLKHSFDLSQIVNLLFLLILGIALFQSYRSIFKIK